MEIYKKAIETVLADRERLKVENRSLSKNLGKELELENIRTTYEINKLWEDKIKEKIEELNREEIELQNSISEEEREKYSDANISYLLMDIEIKRSVLEELLKGSE